MRAADGDEVDPFGPSFRLRQPAAMSARVREAWSAPGAMRLASGVTPSTCSMGAAEVVPKARRGLEGFAPGFGRGEPAQERDAVGRGLAGEPADQGQKESSILSGRSMSRMAPGLAVFVEVDAGERRAAGHGGEKIEEIGVLGGAGAEDGVGVDHGVGFGPGDGLAQSGGRCRGDRARR